jgi:hypothetical protein
MIMAHQDELESLLASCFSEIAPEVIGNKYLVLGTVEKRTWQKGLKENSNQIDEVLQHTADFKKVVNLGFEPGGWYPPGK